MKIEARSFRDTADLLAMRQLLIAGTQSQIPASYMHPGVLDWALHNPPDEQANRSNVLLWERVDDRQPTLQAWAIFLSDEGSFDLFVHPKLYGTALHERAMGEFVAWAEVRARKAGLAALWPFWAMEYDVVLIRLMRESGYVENQVDPAPPLFHRSLDGLPSVDLPAGFSLRGVQSLDDGRLRARVAYEAFQTSDEWDDDRQSYRRFIDSEVYSGERDLLVHSPDGQGASVCTIWFDEVNRVGLFEPVATRPDFQGQGLGKAVMAEGLRRMKLAGMQQAMLGFNPENVAARALYSSMGFKTAYYFATYSKALT